MPTSAHFTALAFFQETQSGTGPANAAAWVASGVRLGPKRGSVDVSGIGEDMVADERAISRVFDEQEGQHGIDNPEFPAEFEFETNNVVTADTVQIAQTAQMQFFGHMLGGLDRGTASTASGTHSVTTIEPAATTGMDEGTFIAPALSAYTRAPAACHLRRIATLAAGVATVDQAFPNAPVDTDVVNPVATAYINQADLIDSSANDSTLSWLIQRGPTGGVQNWEVVGGKTQLDSIDLSRGALASFVTTTFGGSSSDPSEAPSPAWVDEPSLTPGVVVGPDTQVWFENYGITTNTLLDVSTFSITPGVPVSRDEVVTSNTDGMEGTSCYTTRTESTMIELNCVFNSSATAFWDDWDANQLKTVRFSTLRPAGQNVGFSFPRCQVQKVSAVENGDALHVSMTLKCLEDTVNASAANDDLWRSKMTVHWY